MTSVPLKSMPYGNIDPRGLTAGFLALDQPAVPTADGILLSPRVAGGAAWLNSRELARANFDADAFTKTYFEIDGRINQDARLDLKNRAEAKGAVRRWLDGGDFGQMAYELLETSSPDQRHLFLREIVLPVFFEKYPGGRLACVTYDEHANGYLALLNTLKKSQILNSRDPQVISRYAGKFGMSSFALNVPAEMIWLMLSFVSVMCFPEASAFVASCEHRYFLVFITDCPISISRGENRYGPVARLMPKFLSVLDAKEEAPGIVLSDDYVRCDRQFPFNRRNHTPEAIVEFLSAYVKHLDEFLRWLCEATNFVARDGQFDVDFALQTYLTVYVLLNTTFRILIEETDMFARKMAMFDVLELYAAMVDCSGVSAQALAWKMHLQDDFISDLLSTLRTSYPTPFAEDLTAGTNELLMANRRVMEQGLVYGKNPDGTVMVPNKGSIPFDDYAVALLRALRNTKHGFAIRDEDYLAVHSGDFGNDLPDYALSLWLGFVADRNVYHLKH